MNKDFTEISAVKSLLPHVAHFSALEQCRERSLIFIAGIFNPHDCLSLASEERVAVNECAGTETLTT